MNKEAELKNFLFPPERDVPEMPRNTNIHQFTSETTPAAKTVEHFELMPAVNWYNSRVGRLFPHPNDYKAYENMTLGEARFQIVRDFNEASRDGAQFHPGDYSEAFLFKVKMENQPKSVEKSESTFNPNLTPEGLQGNIQTTIDHAKATIQHINERMDKRGEKIRLLQNEHDEDIQWRDSLAQSIHRLTGVLDSYEESR